MPSRLIAPKGVPATLVDFEHAGATLIAESFGEGGHPFVLLHGIGMGRSVFLDLARHLPGRYVGIDLPGFGEAPEPAQTLTMERHADLVAAFLRNAEISDAVVIGHSMGSQIAAEVAARHPDVVAGLVLAGPTVNSSARSVVSQASYLLRDLLGERFEVFWRGAREYLRGGPNLIRKIRATVVHDSERAYASVTVPTLVLRGESDPLAPVAWCRRIIEAIPGSEFAEIPDHGHGTIIGDAEPAARIIERFSARL